MAKKASANVLVLGDKEKFLRSQHPILKQYKSLHCFEIQAIKIRQKEFSIPRKKFDYCLISSANIPAQCLKRVKAFQWVFIGGRSFLEFRDLAENAIQVSPSSSRGILKYFQLIKKERGEGASIFFPRSSRGDPDLVKKLRKLGFKVALRHVYDTQSINFSKELKALLSRESIDYVFFMSPSGVSAFRKSVPIATLRTWSPGLLSIGPTTDKALRSLKSKI